MRIYNCYVTLKKDILQTFKKFEYGRKRGIVWVCDVVQSSKYLNSNDSVDDIEKYLPRLYWTSSNIVKAFGGEFIKWTGDGFLAWFETPLDRNKLEIANNVFKAAWHLSFLNNITQLALNPKEKFKIRHGISYEKDALTIKIFENEENYSLDLIGRAVVLAFRLSGIQAHFPSIVTEKELVIQQNEFAMFKKWEPTSEDKLKYFKGEELGLETIYVSSKKTYPKNKNLSELKEKADKSINDIDNPDSSKKIEHIPEFIELMKAGPDWCQEVIDLEVKFIREELLGSLKKVMDLLEKKGEENVT